MPERPSPATVAWQAIRPQTLSLSLAPVLVGTGLAYGLERAVHWGLLAVTLACALLIQIATNLHNDAVDCLKGNDLPDRPGPLRVCAAGLASPRMVRRWAIACLVLAFAGGCVLVHEGGALIVAIGLASLLAAWAYSGGPRPIAYTPFGEVFVLMFFGLLAVLGTAHLQGVTAYGMAALVGLGVGAPAAAVLLINNARDREADRRVGRQTLAILLGPARVGHCYAGFLLAPPALGLGLAMAGWRGALGLCLLLPWNLGLIRRFRAAREGMDFNRLLASTAGHAFCLAVGLALALAWGRA